MEKIKEELIKEAIKKFKKIKPCLRHEDFSNSFTKYGNSIIFWFNTEDQTTRVLTSKIKK